MKGMTRSAPSVVDVGGSSRSVVVVVRALKGGTKLSRTGPCPSAAARSCLPTHPPRSTQQAAAIDAQHAALDLSGAADRAVEHGQPPVEQRPHQNRPTVAPNGAFGIIRAVPER